MSFNFWAPAIAALIPLIVAALWYHPALGGRVVAPATGRPMTAGRTALRIGLFLLFGIMLSMALMPAVIHQMHLYSLVANRPKPEAEALVGPLMKQFGSLFRTAKHGAFHGTLTAIFLALPVLGISALAGRRPAKTVLVHAGYFIVTLALMGGVLCAYL